MGHLDKFNLITPEDLEKREEFDRSPKETQEQEMNRLNEQALNENVDSFYKMIEKETDQ